MVRTLKFLPKNRGNSIEKGVFSTLFLTNQAREQTPNEAIWQRFHLILNLCTSFSQFFLRIAFSCQLTIILHVHFDHRRLTWILLPFQMAYQKPIVSLHRLDFIKINIQLFGLYSNSSIDWPISGIDFLNAITYEKKERAQFTPRTLFFFLALCFICQFTLWLSFGCFFEGIGSRFFLSIFFGYANWSFKLKFANYQRYFEFQINANWKPKAADWELKIHENAF